MTAHKFKCKGTKDESCNKTVSIDCGSSLPGNLIIGIDSLPSKIDFKTILRLEKGKSYKFNLVCEDGHWNHYEAKC